MLLAVLLSLLPAALPADVRQDPAPQGEPFLQWDGETEDAYRRALHLWQVRGKPGEAADILLKLADSAEVTQVAGQASWVLVLAAQALAEAGRTDEASALIPGIERGSRGTTVEDFVLRDLALLNGNLGLGIDGLDPTFKKYLRDSLRTGGTSHDWLSTQYSRTLLPYILDIVEEWENDKSDTGLIRPALMLGWLIADQSYVERLKGVADRMSTLAFLTVFSGWNTSGDLVAKKATLVFWLHCMKSVDAQRARLASLNVARFYSVIDRDTDEQILQLALSSDAQMLSEILQRLRNTDSEESRAHLRRIASEADPDPARSARFELARFGIEEVVAFASSGALEDVARYLALIISIRVGNYGSGSGSVQEVVSQLAQECGVPAIGWSNAQDRSRQPIWSPPPVTGWNGPLDISEHLLENEAIRSLLALAAVGLDDASALERALSQGPPRYSDLLMAVLAIYQGPTCPSLWRDMERYSQLATTDAISTLMAQSGEGMPIGLVPVLSRVLGEGVGNWKLMFDRWINAGRVKDVGSIVLDRQLSWSVRVSAATALRQSDEHLDTVVISDLLQGWQELDLRDRGSLHYSIELVWAMQPESILPKDYSDLIKLAYEADKTSFLVQYLLNKENPEAWKVVFDFITNADRARWISRQRHELMAAPSAPMLALTLLRAGVLDSEFLPQDPDSKSWIQPGSPGVVEAARLLLQSAESGHRMNVLWFLRRDGAAYKALMPELDPFWTNPEYAGTMAITAAEHAREIDPYERLVAAWELPFLQNRSLVLRAMINTTDSRFVPILLEAISDSDDKVAATARDGLQRLKEIEEQRAFWESWQATGVGGSPTAALLKQIQSKNKEVRLSAIRALGAIKAPEALPLLISLLEDPDPEVVAAARAGLAWLQPPAVPK